MKKNILLLAILFLLIGSSNAQGDWKTLKTGAGGWITGMDIHPSGTPVFCRSDVGSAYRWNETLQEWTNIVTAANMPAADVDWDKFQGVLSIVSAPSNANVAYMAYYEGIYKSTDQGDTWVKTNLPVMEMNSNTDEGKLSGERLSVDPLNENIVYFGSLDDGLWRTRDGGSSWERVTPVPAGELGRGIRQVLFDATRGNINGRTRRIYAMSDAEGVYQSDNGGGAWALISFGVADPYFYDSEMSADGRLYVCGESAGGLDYGVQQYDGGSWTQVYLGSTVMGEIAIDPFNTNRVYILSNGFTETYRSLNANSSNPSWQSLSHDREALNIPWMSWVPATWFTLGEVLFDPVVPDQIWISEGIGVWRTTDINDSNMTWTEVSDKQEHLVSNDMVALPSGDIVTAHWDRPVFHHSNLDAYPAIHQPSSRFNSCWDLDYTPADPDYVVALIEDHRFCCYDNDTRSSGYSEDGGLTWTKFATMPEPGNSNMIYGQLAVAANDKDNIVWLPAGNRMPYYTTNRGQSWTQVTLPNNSGNCCITANYFKRKPLVADRVLPNTFYIYDWGEGHIFKSSDSGQSWTRYANVLTSFAYNGKLLAVPGQAGHLFFANGAEQARNLIEGLYHSIDGGQSWTILPNTDEVLNVAVGKEAPGASYPTIYIQGKVNNVQGYFKSIDEGVTWTLIGTYPNDIYDEAAVMEGDLNEYGKLYVGFGGNGFVYYSETQGPPCNDANGDGICDFSDFFHVDQFGYRPNASKVVVINDPQTGYNASQSYTPGSQLELREVAGDVVVYIGAPQVWNNGATHVQSGDKGWWFDFSSITATGEYYIYDPSTQQRSANFRISDDAYNEVLEAATKMYYYNRCGFEKVAPYAEPGWTDNISFNHPLQDANCRFVYNPGDASLERDLSGGWFDAGDYNKYVTFTHSVIHNLLWAYGENPTTFGDDWNIPESGNGIPDLLDEVKWELDWLLKMTNSDGSVIIKMGSIDYADNALAPPSANTDQRYYGPTCSSASIAMASVLAHAAKVFEQFPAMSSYAAQLRTNAENAWNYALPLLNNNQLETDCDDGTIKSGDADWDIAAQRENAVGAAIYLFDLTASTTYNDYAIANINDTEQMASNYWSGYKMAVNDALLLYTTLPGADVTIAGNILNSLSSNAISNFSGFYGFNTDDLYRAFIPDASYHWGSNSIKAGMGLLNKLLVKYGINPSSSSSYEQKAEEQLHYFHGVNPQGLVYLSNMYGLGGDRCANEIYHTWFADGTIWDNAQTSTYGPAPGFLTGGPNKNFTVSTLIPPYGQPDQKSYLDFNDDFPNNSWEITEPAIYYQANYIRLLAGYSNNGNGPTCNDGIQNGQETGVDCGGPQCPPCPCQDTEVTLTLNFDDYPEETSWGIVDAAGAIIASGGPYPNQPDGSTLSIVVCLPDGCYDLTIFDSASDGMCCDYGNGSYSLNDPAGMVLASGGNFGASETTNFCLGGSGCSPVLIDDNDFELGWGIWNDGGDDCRRDIRDARAANSGSFCVRLRDQSSTSVMTTDPMDWTNYDEVSIAFSYLARKFSLADEDFWLDISLDGGTTFSPVEEWNYTGEFVNNTRYADTVTINGPFTNNCLLRFRCDASSNTNKIYLDDIVIEGCAIQGSSQMQENPSVLTHPGSVERQNDNGLTHLNLFPNPNDGAFMMTLKTSRSEVVRWLIQDVSGRVIYQDESFLTEGWHRLPININGQIGGMYFLTVIGEHGKTGSRFVLSGE